MQSGVRFAGLLFVVVACGRTHAAEHAGVGGQASAGSSGATGNAAGVASIGGSGGTSVTAGGSSSVGGGNPSAGGSAGGSLAEGGETLTDAGAGGAPSDPEPTGDFTWALWPMPNSASSGLPNPASYDASSPDVVLDNVTGLAWQAHLPEYMSWTVSKLYCDALALGGHTDWRLPSRIELVSLMSYGVTTSITDPAVFPGEPGASIGFWSSSVFFDTPASVWVVYGYGEGSGPATTTTQLPTRCVRTATSHRSPLPHYKALDTVVLDNWTGLYWERQPVATWLGQDAQMARCAALSQGGFDDWRVASLKELLTVLDEHRSWPAIDPLVFPGQDTVQSGWFWSSTRYPAVDGHDPDGPGVQFAEGNVMSQGSASFPLLARCVR